LPKKAVSLSGFSSFFLLGLILKLKQFSLAGCLLSSSHKGEPLKSYAIAGIKAISGGRILL
jgi:hypothetical protein